MWGVLFLCPLLRWQFVLSACDLCRSSTAGPFGLSAEIAHFGFSVRHLHFAWFLDNEGVIARLDHRQPGSRPLRVLLGFFDRLLSGVFLACINSTHSSVLCVGRPLPSMQTRRISPCRSLFCLMAASLKASNLFVTSLRRFSPGRSTFLPGLAVTS